MCTFNKLTRRSCDMYMSQNWRNEHLAKVLQTWASRIGERATRTRMRSRWTAQISLLVALLYIMTTTVWQVASGKHAGAALAVPAIAFWPIILFLVLHGLRLSLRAIREAGQVAGTSEKTRPPVNSVELFERWVKTSKYSRYKDEVPPWDS